MTKAEIREKIRLGKLNKQSETEMFGRRVDQIRREQGLTPEELARRVPSIPQGYLSQLLEGQALFGIRLEWKRGLAAALGLVESRKQDESLSEEDIDSLFLPELPYQHKLNL